MKRAIVFLDGRPFVALYEERDNELGSPCIFNLTGEEGPVTLTDEEHRWAEKTLQETIAENDYFRRNPEDW